MKIHLNFSKTIIPRILSRNLSYIKTLPNLITQIGFMNGF